MLLLLKWMIGSNLCKMGAKRHGCKNRGKEEKKMTMPWLQKRGQRGEEEDNVMAVKMGANRRRRRHGCKSEGKEEKRTTTPWLQK